MLLGVYSRQYIIPVRTGPHFSYTSLLVRAHYHFNISRDVYIHQPFFGGALIDISSLVNIYGFIIAADAFVKPFF